MSEGTRARPPARLSIAGVVFGAGLAGTLDEVMFHQILHWHHLYDRSTSEVGHASDGLLHAASTLMLLLGGRVILAERAAGRARDGRAIAAVLVGLGGFNVYDGTVQHKVLRLHQVRYDVDLAVYDALFIGLSAAILLVGAILWRTANRAGAAKTISAG